MNLRPMMRTSAGVAMAASVAALLAACGSSKPANPSACDGFTSGTATSAVTVSGAFNADPTIKVTGSPTASSVERNVLIKGSGASPATADTVNVRMTLFNTAGTKIAVQSQPIPLSDTANNPFLEAALRCSPYGSRVVVAAPASKVFLKGVPSPLKASDTLILVSDLVSKYTAPPPPKPAAWTTQVPTVTFAANGTPKVTLVGKPMKRWSIKVLKQGNGAVVKAGQNVTVNYQGTSWNKHKIFDQSYGRGPATFNTAQVVQGFGDAIVGQKVGTTFIVTMPPALGYGTNPNDPNARGLGGQTLVFVIEIQSAS